MPSSPGLFTSLLFCAALAASAAAPRTAPAQQQQAPPRAADPEEVLRVTTELVQTDVAVFDRGGKFVDNLKAGEFELKVDGRVQPISFFETIVAGSYDEDAQLAAARGGARTSGKAGKRAGAAVPLDRGRAVVFFLDDLHLSPRSMESARRLLTRFVNERLRQNDVMLVATATGQLGFLQQPTDDKAVLRSAVSRLAYREMTARDPERPAMNIAQAIAVEQNNQNVIDYFVDLMLREFPPVGNPEAARQQAAETVRRRAGSLIDQTAAIATRTLDGLRALVRSLAGQPGRKLVYFVSDGFAVESRRSGMHDRLRVLTDAAVRVGAVVYSVDARGLGAHMSDLPGAADDSAPDPGGRLSGVPGLAEATQEPLRTIAGETGGRALLNTNSLDDAVSRALEETSRYYLLAWRPDREENRGGRYRRIDVSVKGRPDLTVLAQRGFYTTPPPDPAARDSGPRRDAAKTPRGGAQAAPSPAATRDAELFAALRSPYPRAGLPTALTTNFLLNAEGGIVLLSSVKVEIEASRPAAGAGAPTDRVDLAGAVYDERGKVVSTFRRSLNITPRSADVEVPEGHAVTVGFQAAVTPGLYQVRVAGHDPKNGRTGSALQWVEVPNLKGGAMSLSSVFLGVAPPARTAAAAAGGEPQLSPQLVVRPDRRFSRDEPLRFLVYLYNPAAAPGGAPDVVLQLQIFRDDQPVVTTPLRKIETEGMTDFRRIPYAAELPLKNLPAGRYLFIVTAIDRAAKTTAKQRAKFIID